MKLYVRAHTDSSAYETGEKPTLPNKSIETGVAFIEGPANPNKPMHRNWLRNAVTELFSIPDESVAWVGEREINGEPAYLLIAKPAWRLPLSAEQRHALYTALGHIVSGPDPWREKGRRRQSEVMQHLKVLRDRLETLEEVEY
jgi:hypothetical protein